MNKPQNIPAVIYARVSSKEQEREGFSIPSQQKLLREYAERKGFMVVSEFVEAETAKRAGRTKFSEMIKFFHIESRKKGGAGCRTLLVEKTDRLYRNFKDYVTLEDIDLEIHLVKENEILSKKSRSQQKFIHSIKVVMSKSYIDNLSEEIKKGMLEKAEQGLYPSYAPLGYLNTSIGGIKSITPDPEVAPLVKNLFLWYSSGNFSLNEINSKIRESGLESRRGGLTVSRSAIAKILNNPVYHGEFIWNKLSYKGNYEPLISKEIYEKVQNVLNFKGSTRTGIRKHHWLFHGLVSCGHCGCAMVAEIKKGKYVYYRCTGYKGKCPEKYVREETLNLNFETALESIRLDSDVINLVVKALKESRTDEKRIHQEAVTILAGEKKKLENRLEALYIDKLDGNISKDDYEQKSKKWHEQLQLINLKLEKHGNAHLAYMDEGVQLLELAQNAVEIYRKFDSTEKRRILQLVLSNSIWLNAQLVPKFRQPFDLFALTNSQIKVSVESGDPKTGNKDEWCTGRDSNSRPLPSEGSALSS